MSLSTWTRHPPFALSVILPRMDSGHLQTEMTGTQRLFCENEGSEDKTSVLCTTDVLSLSDFFPQMH